MGVRDSGGRRQHMLDGKTCVVYQRSFLPLYPALWKSGHSSSRSMIGVCGASSAAVLVGYEVLSEVASSDRSSCSDDGLLYIYPWLLFLIFTQSLDAIDVTSVTRSRLNSINAIDVARYFGDILRIF